MVEARNEPRLIVRDQKVAAGVRLRPARRARWRFLRQDPDPPPDHEGGVSGSDCILLPGYFLAIQERNVYFLQEGIDLGVFPGQRFKAVAMTEVIQL